MSRLHNPGPGEILDRLTILALKIVHGQMAGRDITHWVEERDALDNLKVPNIPILRVVELAAVNGALWQAEDDLRRERTATEHYVSQTAVIAQTAIRIQQLNDRRAALVSLINVNAGVDRPPDKL